MQSGQAQRGRSTIKCYKCGGYGHKKADCPSPDMNTQPAPHSEYRYRPRYQTSRNGTYYHNKKLHQCLVCGKFGHREYECRFRYQGPQLRKQQNEAPDDNKFHVCENCMQVGHSFANCPNNRRCRRCGEEGHTSRNCGNAVLCRNCFQLGHWAHNCPNEPVCANCRESGHIVRDCPQLVENSE